MDILPSDSDQEDQECDVQACPVEPVVAMAQDQLPDEVFISDSNDLDGDAMPSDDEFGWLNPNLHTSCCQRKCCVKFLDAETGRVREELLALWSHLRAFENNDEATKFIYRLLQESANRGQKFVLLGKAICKNAFRILCLVGNGKIHRLRQHLVRGFSDPPRDLRHSSPSAASTNGKISHKSDVVDSFFADLWNAGQPFADDELRAVTIDSKEYGGEIVVAAPVVVNSCAEWVTGKGPTASYTEAVSGDIRWIAEEPLVDLYEQLRSWCVATDVDCPSFSTMYKLWNEKWSQRIHMKPVGHMGKCDTCERFKQLRRLATSPEDHARIREGFHEHLTSAVYCPRAVEAHLAYSSERSLRGLVPITDSCHLVRTLIDAMEQAKLKCPRNISMAKQFSTMWRPQCALFGAIMHQELEVFWVVDPDIVKEANLEITLLSRLLHLGSEVITVPMPRQWSNHCDNATGEGKNQTVAKFYAWETWKRTFDCTEMTNSKVGHGHNEQDQRFAEATTALMNARELGRPGDFVNVLRERVVPRKNRRLVVERLRSSLDWKQFFSVLPTNMSGHVQTKNMKANQVEACHVWRFICRENFACEKSISTAWPDVPPHGRDVILLVKHTIDADRYSQDPVVFATHQHMSQLGPGPASDAPRGKLSARQVHEFTNTADKIEARPWLMVEAAQWMRQWLQANADGTSTEWQPPCIDWALADHSDNRTEVIPSSLVASDVCFADTVPGVIRVGSKPRGRVDDCLPEQEPRAQGPNISSYCYVH